MTVQAMSARNVAHAIAAMGRGEGRMPKGGARPRSGPAPNPNSQRSMANGVKLRMLPPDGHKGRAPKFPLPDVTAREQDVWRKLWKSPQAAMWAENPWLHDIVALYTRVAVLCEAPDANIGMHAQRTKYANQIGFNPTGLAAFGWSIGHPELVTNDLPGTTVRERDKSNHKFKGQS